MSRYVIITGGGFSNKGAQSMTFITVNEIKNRFPDKKIVLLSETAYKLDANEKSMYDFDILPVNTDILFSLAGWGYKIAWSLKTKNINNSKHNAVIPKLQEVLKNTDYIVDVSGYTLSSQRAVGLQLSYLFTIMVAKKYGIKVYLMPQSFGPFDYSGKKKSVLEYLIRKSMRYPEVIFAREKEGYNYLKNEFGLKNVKKSYDLVLLNKDIDVSKVYKKIPEYTEYKNARDVAIVPNMRNFDHGNKEQIIALYDSIIKKLLKENKMVYLIRHSQEDIEACEILKARFPNNENVALIVDDMSCIEFDALVKKFDFLIASRFHSIVHAYKNNVPCIALGWATKYHELLSIFNQEEYIFDVRENIDSVKVEKAIDKLLTYHNTESQKILSILKKVQNYNVFDEIKGEKLIKVN
jgi:polysaccharide pyruvyl transferase WcaK-like protein